MTTLAEVRDLLEVAVQVANEGCVGVLALPDAGSWPDSTSTDAAFGTLVSGMYVWLRDLWPEHLNFLRRASGQLNMAARATRDLRAHVNALRTAREHALDSLNPRDAQTAVDVAEWYRRAVGTRQPTNSAQWQRCGAELLAQAYRALQEVVDVLRAVRQDGSLNAQWVGLLNAAAEIDLGGLRVAIARDLGINLRPYDADHVDRQVERRWRQRVARGDASSPDELAKAIVVRELSAWSLVELPVGIEELVERLDVRGRVRVIAGVRLAQAVWEAKDFDDLDEYLDTVEVAWNWLLDE